MKKLEKQNLIIRVKRLFFLTVLTSLSIFSNATIISIPKDFTTIQDGLDAALAGDTVMVSPGSYYENLIWPSIDSIKLLSKGDSSNTILISNLDAKNISFPSYFNISNETKISGFKLTNNDTSSSSFGAIGILLGSLSSPTIEDIFFTNYTYSGNGNLEGLIWMSDNCSPIIKNCRFSKISANQVSRVYGGAIHISYHCNPTINNIIIEDYSINASNRIHGGAIYIEQFCNPILKNIIIRDMEMTTPYWNYGAGIYISDNCNPTLSNIQITHLQLDSSSWNYGGAIFIEKFSNPIFNNIQINQINIDVSARVCGGAIYIRDYSSPSFTNTYIHDLTLTSTGSFKGGAIYLDDSSNYAKFDSLTISNLNGYSENDLQGLGIFIRSSNPQLSNVVIQNGTGAAKHYCEGGGVYLSNSSSPYFIGFVICGNTIEGNIEGSSNRISGAGISIGDNSNAVFVNGLITGNLLIGSSSNCYGSGVYMAINSTPSFINCTIADNASTGSIVGTGVYSQFNSHPIFTNCIIRNPNTGNEIDMDANSNTTITHSNIRSGYVGAGNIDLNPMFYSDSCYILTSISPSFGTGTIVGAPAYDINGNSRPAQGNTNPSMGAFENTLPKFLGKDTIVCGNSYTIEPNGYGSYLWPAIRVTSSGLYSVESYYGCCSFFDTIYVTLDNPVVNLGDDTIIGKDTIVLDAGPGMSSYLWSDGSTNQTLNVWEEGVYSVTVVSYVGCTAFDDIYIGRSVGIKDKESNDFEIYPNPATNHFTINLEAEHNITIIRIYSSSGVLQNQLHASKNKKKYIVYAKNMTTGIYFVQAIDISGNMLMKKLVLN